MGSRDDAIDLTNDTTDESDFNDDVPLRDMKRRKVERDIINDCVFVLKENDPISNLIVNELFLDLNEGDSRAIITNFGQFYKTPARMHERIKEACQIGNRSFDNNSILYLPVETDEKKHIFLIRVNVFEKKIEIFDPLYHMYSRTKQNNYYKSYFKRAIKFLSVYGLCNAADDFSTVINNNFNDFPQQADNDCVVHIWKYVQLLTSGIEVTQEKFLPSDIRLYRTEIVDSILKIKRLSIGDVFLKNLDTRIIYDNWKNKK